MRFAMYGVAPNPIVALLLLVIWLVVGGTVLVVFSFLAGWALHKGWHAGAPRRTDS